jgi:hypothetical protein
VPDTTGPESNVGPSPRLKFVKVIVAEFIGLLKVAVIIWLTGTLGAPFTGFVKITAGGTRSGAAPVLNVHTKLLANSVFARSVAPVVIVAVYTVLAKRLAFGAKVAMLFTAS